MLRRNKFLNIDFEGNAGIKNIIVTATQICQSAAGALVLTDDQFQYVKSKIGAGWRSTALRDKSFDLYARQNKVAVIYDIFKYNEFACNSPFTESSGYRFYAAVPLIDRTGRCLGFIYVADKQPKHLAGDQENMLQILSSQAIDLLEMEYDRMMIKAKAPKIVSTETILKTIPKKTDSPQLASEKDWPEAALHKAFREYLMEFGVNKAKSDLAA